MTLFDGKPIEPEECLIICDPCRLYQDHKHCKPVKGKPCECPECHLVKEEEL